MIYSLSHEQKEAVRILWNELGYDVGRIVNSFIVEDYPVTEAQVMKVIQDDEKLSYEQIFGSWGKRKSTEAA
jgi:hypothetical protein